MAQSDTYGNWVIWRGFQVDGDPKPAVETTKKIFRMYPLSQKDNPPTMNFINVSGKNFNTIHRTGPFQQNSIFQSHSDHARRRA